MADNNSNNTNEKKSGNKVSAIAGGALLAAAGGIIFLANSDDKSTAKPSAEKNSATQKYTNAYKVKSKGSAKAVFAVPEGKTASEEELNAIAASLEDRLLDYYVIADEKKVDAAQQSISIDFTWELPVELDAYAMVEDIAREYRVSVRKDSETGEIIADDEDIDSASPEIRTNKDGGQDYIVSLDFNDEAAKRFNEAVSGDSPIVFCIDDKVVYTADEAADCEDGVLKIGTDYQTIEDALGYACAIDNSALPFAMTVKSYEQAD